MSSRVFMHEGFLAKNGGKKPWDSAAERHRAPLLTLGQEDASREQQQKKIKPNIEETDDLTEKSASMETDRDVGGDKDHHDMGDDSNDMGGVEGESAMECENGAGEGEGGQYDIILWSLRKMKLNQECDYCTLMAMSTCRKVGEGGDVSDSTMCVECLMDDFGVDEDGGFGEENTKYYSQSERDWIMANSTNDKKLEVPGVEKFYRFPVPQHISEAFHHPLCNSCYEKKACSVWSSKENHYDLFMYCSDCK